jgi:hypothetical protein
MGIVHPFPGSYQGTHSIRAQTGDKCGVINCPRPMVSVRTGLCESHHERFMDRALDEARGNNWEENL